MEEYRKKAQSTYYKQLEEKKLEQEQELKKEQEQELKKEQEQKIKNILDKWDELMELFPIPITFIEEFHEIVKNEISLCKEYERMEDIQNRMIRLVEIFNTQHEVIPHSVEEVCKVHDVMKEMMKTCEVDVKIETMDVSQDETIAQQIQTDFFQEVRENEQIGICSFSRRIGLTIPQLKDIAKTHSLSQKGNKEELCRRLSDAGLVQMIE